MKFMHLRETLGSSLTFLSILLYLEELFTGTNCQDMNLTLIQPALFNSSCSGLLSSVERYSYKIIIDTNGTTAMEWPRVLKFSTMPKTNGSPSQSYALDFTMERCVTDNNRTFCSHAKGGGIYEITSEFVASATVSEGTFRVIWENNPPSRAVQMNKTIPHIYDDSKMALKVNGKEYDLGDGKCTLPLEEGETYNYTFCATRADISSVTITFGKDAQTEDKKCITRLHSHDGEDKYNFTYRDGCGRKVTHVCSIEDICSPGCSDGAIVGFVIASLGLICMVIFAACLIKLYRTGKGLLKLGIIGCIIGVIVWLVIIILIAALDCTSCESDDLVGEPAVDLL